MQCTLTIPITTRADVTAEQVAKLVQNLIDIGLADAADTMASGEGDLTPAELATDLQIGAPVALTEITSEAVKHWEAYGVTDAPLTHRLEFIDRRRNCGHGMMTLGELGGEQDAILEVAMEVASNPLSATEQVPSALVYFDGESLAMTLFKIGDRLLLRPEVDVQVAAIPADVEGLRETLLWFWIR